MYRSKSINSLTVTDDTRIIFNSISPPIEDITELLYVAEVLAGSFAGEDIAKILVEATGPSKTPPFDIMEIRHGDNWVTIQELLNKLASRFQEFAEYVVISTDNQIRIIGA